MLAALLLAALCTPAAIDTPTPVGRWDAATPGTNGAPIVGYSVYYNATGGTPQLLVDMPDEPYDTDEDGIPDHPWFRGVDLGIPLQRYCPTCQPFNLYEFRVKAYDASGKRSVDYSNAITVCFPQICAIRSGPCQ